MSELHRRIEAENNVIPKITIGASLKIDGHNYLVHNINPACMFLELNENGSVAWGSRVDMASTLQNYVQSDYPAIGLPDLSQLSNRSARPIAIVGALDSSAKESSVKKLLIFGYNNDGTYGQILDINDKARLGKHDDLMHPTQWDRETNPQKVELIQTSTTIPTSELINSLGVASRAIDKCAQINRIIDALRPPVGLLPIISSGVAFGIPTATLVLGVEMALLARLHVLDDQARNIILSKLNDPNIRNAATAFVS